MNRAPIYRATKQVQLEPPLLEAIQSYCNSQGGLSVAARIKDLIDLGLEASGIKAKFQEPQS
jgi:hypothetical protein